MPSRTPHGAGADLAPVWGIRARAGRCPRGSTGQRSIVCRAVHSAAFGRNQRQQATGSRQQATGNRQQAAGNRQQAAGRNLRGARRFWRIIVQCGRRLPRCRRIRRRVIEDIPELIAPLVTEHLLHRDYGPLCRRHVAPVVTEHLLHRDYGPHGRRHVEPVVPDALPHATLGHRVIGLTSGFHYGLGVTLDPIVGLLGGPLQTELTPGGLVPVKRRNAETSKRRNVETPKRRNAETPK